MILYEQIYQDLLNAILKNDYRSGDKMPSEKELSEHYGVSRITSKKAMDLLAEKRYITRTPGRGSFVNEIEKETAESLAKREGAERGRKVVGVLFDCFNASFGCELLKSIEQECHRQEYDMMFWCSYGDEEMENRALDHALEAGVDGLVLMCIQDETYNSRVLRLALDDFPIVCVDRGMSGISVPCVKTDNYKAAREMTDLLIQRGHQKICLVTHSSVNTGTIRERHDGFVECILDHDGVKGVIAKLESFNPTPERVDDERFANYDCDEVERLICENLECTAFFVVEFQIGMLFYRKLKEMKIEREIVTFDGLQGGYDRENPFIHVRQDEYLMGKQAVEALADIVKGKRMEENIVIPYEIVWPE